MRKLKNLFLITKNKLAVVREVLFANGYLRPIQIVDLEVARAKVSSVLSEELRIENARQDQTVLEITDKIVGRLYETDFTSMSLMKYQDHLFKVPMWEYSLLASMSALWEWRVKLLAERFGVSTGRKQLRSDGEVLAFRFRNMELIVNDLNRITSNRLKLSLHELRGIRNCLLHGSFHQLREEMTLLRPDKEQSHRGNIFVMQIGTGQISNLSDIQTEEEIRTQDIYGWMLEACNSGLFLTVREEFEKSLKGIWLLIDFKAHSFDERARLFEKVIFNGHRLTAAEEELYSLYGSSIGNRIAFGNRYFTDLYSFLDL